MAELKKIRQPRATKDEIATSQKDIDIFGGWLNRLENPDPVLRTESAGQGLKLYDEIDRDPHAGAVLQTRYLSVVGKEWEVLPAEEAKGKGRPPTVTQAQKIADFVYSAFENCNFDQFRQELLQGILYGFYVAEIMWEIQGNSWMPVIIRSKHPRRFSFTMDRELRLLTPADMVEGEPVPDRKFIQFTYGSSDNPYGSGLGRKLWWPVWFKKHGIKFWLVFLEKYGMPTAIGKYPPGTTPEQQNALLDAIDAIQTETGVKIPETMAIELLEATRQGKVTYETLCEYMDAQVSKAVLGQTLTTEVGSQGSYAASQTHESVRQDILKADADLLCECLNESLVRWIVDLNYPGVSAYPKFWIRTDEEKDLKELAERDKILAQDIGLPITRRYFYNTYAIDEPEEGEETVERQQQQSVPPNFAEFVSNRHLDRFSFDDLDKVSHKASQASQDAISVLLAPVLKLIEDGDSYAEIGEKIYDLYPDLDSRDFQELLARAMFTGAAGGYVASREDNT